MDDQLRELVDAADINGLLRAVDGLCASRDWDGMEELADHCMDAVERGKQLWPITAHIDYRLALEAPGDYAADVLESDLGRFSVGPLTEVAASTHTWAELAPHIESAQAAAYVAQERVLRGEGLDGDQRAHPDVMELPLRLQPFEPTYALAKFLPHEVEVAEVWEPKARPVPLTGEPAAIVPNSAVTDVLLDLVQPWTQESNGAARAVFVEGDAPGAVAALAAGIPGDIHVTRLAVPEALQRIAWAAASGGAHGRRRGAAFGRFMAFYLVAALAGLRWPAAVDDIATAAARLRWFLWDDSATKEGWIFRLAIEHDDGWATAIGATDLKTDEPD